MYIIAHLGQVLGRTTVGVCSLDDANLDLALKARSLGKVDDKGSHQSGDLVTVKHVELGSVIQVVVDQAVGITIETASALSRLELRGQ